MSIPIRRKLGRVHMLDLDVVGHVDVVRDQPPLQVSLARMREDLEDRERERSGHVDHGRTAASPSPPETLSSLAIQTLMIRDAPEAH